MKNRGCVADAFLECFWSAFGGSPPEMLGPIWKPFSDKNLKKCDKGAERYPKVRKKNYLRINVNKCIEK